MRKFLKEKDERKWNYFIGRLGKKDHAILKKLLCAQETSDSDSSKKRKREVKSDESTEDEGKQKKKSKWDGKNFPKKTPTPAQKVKQEKDDVKVKKEKKDKNGKSEDQKNGKSRDKKKGKSEEQRNDENGDKVFYVMINGKKNLVKVVSEDVQDRDSDCSISEQKVPKTLKPFYSVSDSDDDKKKNKQLSQLDGNGNGSACHSFSMIERNTSCVSSSTTGVEECGEKISLPPASSGPSFSDTTEEKKVNVPVKPDTDKLLVAPEITGNDSRETVGYSDDTNHNADNADSNADNADSNADNADKGKEIEKIKLDIKKVFGAEKLKTPTKLFVNKNVNVFQKGDHVLISGMKRKLPALLGDKVNGDDSDSEEYVEVKKKKNKQLSQLDGNGNGSACYSFSMIERNTSCVSSSTTGVEECGEKISLPPS